ncbi:TonB-dependent receptor [Pedosphaera parvula]|nr:TonB-dependent receptor [Pedosphaera parvula]
MKIYKIIGWSSALCLSATLLRAQETNEVELLRRQLKDATENFDKVVREQRQIIDSLNKRLDALSQSQGQITNAQQQPMLATSPSASTNQPSASTPPTNDQATAAEKAKLEEQLAKDLAANAEPAPAKSATAAGKSIDLSQPLTIARAGSAYMNISFDTLMDFGWSTARDPSAQLQLGDHDPIKRGFSLRNAELAVDGAVDPYFKGFGNIVLKLDQNNQTSVELEEAYLVTTSLPHNLQLKAGQFFAAFGRQNPQHPHQWAFVDDPIILTRAFGPDGLRSIGTQLSYLLPLPFYTEAFLGVLDGQGGTSFSFRNPGDPDVTGVSRFRGRATFDRSLRGPQDLVYVPRLASSFEVTEQQTLVLGASGAFGSNETGPHSRSEVYGVDAYWKWKSLNANEGFPFVSFQTEGLFIRYGAGADPTATLPGPLPAENLHDWGMYSQVLWGFKPHWVAGLRGEYVNGDAGAFDPFDPFRGERTRVSPNMTWFPSEFSKIRLQYNFDNGEFIGQQHSVWMQVEFLLGAHGAHKF